MFNRRDFLSLVTALPATAVTALAPALSNAQVSITNVAPPRLLVGGNAESPIELRSVRIHVDIGAVFAQTSVEMVFFNPNRRVLEGELQFPLLDGQQVTGFALDVNGKLRDAVPVDKVRGRQVFEEIVRGQVDPGLLEVTQGNNYKLRVYPLPPQATRSVRIQYSEVLVSANGMSRLRVPLHYGALGQFNFSLRATGLKQAPQLNIDTFGELRFERDGDALAAHIERNGFVARGLLDIDLAVPAEPVVLTGAHAGSMYFYAQIPWASDKNAAQRKPPRHIALLWDSSGSGAARDHARELALLDAYFAQLRDVQVTLIRLRDTAEEPQRFSVTDGQWRQLRQTLRSTQYDGATQLGTLKLPRGIDEALLFSDGLGNYGQRALPRMTVPLFAINSSVSGDAAALRVVAERSGGRLIDLLGDDTGGALQKLLRAEDRIVDVDADGADQLIAVSPFATESGFAVTGRLLQKNAQLRIDVQRADGRRETLRLPLQAERNGSGCVPLQWANARIAQLYADYESNRAEIKRIGAAFGIVTRDTSLIVLERAADYARYELPPPAELAQEVAQLRANAQLQQQRNQTAQLQRVSAMFTQRQAWWQREFPKDAPAVVSRDKQSRVEPGRLAEAAASADGLLRQPAPMNAPQSPAAPAASAEARRFRAEGSANGAPLAQAMRDDSGASPTTTSIQLRPWRPDAPYVDRLRNAASSDLYRIYFDEKPSYANSTAFYLDVADVLFERKHDALALRVLSNLAEMNLENRAVLRILGYRLMQARQATLAVHVFQQVRELAPDEPQSWRDLGLALAAAGKHQQAVDALYEVVVRNWDGRFPEIELIALTELNAIIATAPGKLDVSRIDPRLLKNLPLDLRVVLAWDADNTDIDLWVTDPNGEKSHYGHTLSYQGALMSRDFTRGYGPEEFSLKRAKPGKYKIEANYYGNTQQVLAGATTIQLSFFTGFGTTQQRLQSVTLRLRDRRETVFVGEFEV